MDVYLIHLQWEYKIFFSDPDQQISEIDAIMILI